MIDIIILIHFFDTIEVTVGAFFFKMTNLIIQQSSIWIIRRSNKFQTTTTIGHLRIVCDITVNTQAKDNQTKLTIMINHNFFLYLDLFVLIEDLVLALRELGPLELAANSPTGSSKMVAVSRVISGETSGFDLMIILLILE